MTKQYFNEHVLRCKTCKCKPILVSVSMSNSFIFNPQNVKFRVVCEECQWEDGYLGNRTGLCKTPENALKIWNKKYGE